MQAISGPRCSPVSVADLTSNLIASVQKGLVPRMAQSPDSTKSQRPVELCDTIASVITQVCR
jgi:hypothetical protein